MPFYDYKCTFCEIEKEVIEMYSDSNIHHCDVCSGLMRRQVGGAVVIVDSPGLHRENRGKG